MDESRFISFVLDGKIVSLDFQDPAGPAPTTTVLNYLRSLPLHKGVKEGCAEGDCGACTVVLGEAFNGKLSYRAVDSCLVFLPMINGKQILTVENLRSPDELLHPVQQAMVETGGSQCGYCTPGIIMSLFSLYKSKDQPDRAEIEDCLTGNLCRCTGYKPIVEAAARSCVHKTVDQFSDAESETMRMLQSIHPATIRLERPRQQYWQPASLQEALALRKQHPDALVMCGATDLALRVTKKHELLSNVIDLGALRELKGIELHPKGLRIGAGTSLSAILETLSEEFPALGTMLEVFGSRQIRNLATLGGNLGTASPIGDLLPVLMAYEATITVQSATAQREISIDEFFVGYRKTVLKADEVIVSVFLPRVPNGTTVKSYKISKRKDLDISTLSGCFRLTLNGRGQVGALKLAFGGMAERPKRAMKTETFLAGKAWTRNSVEAATDILDTEFTPISDARSGAAFRRIAAKNLLLKFWSETRS